jgi:hypothetical protein
MVLRARVLPRQLPSTASPVLSSSSIPRFELLLGLAQIALGSGARREPLHIGERHCPGKRRKRTRPIHKTNNERPSGWKARCEKPHGYASQTVLERCVAGSVSFDRNVSDWPSSESTPGELNYWLFRDSRRLYEWLEPTRRTRPLPRLRASGARRVCAGAAVGALGKWVLQLHLARLSDLAMGCGPC